jgi:hypothetical protein
VLPRIRARHYRRRANEAAAGRRACERGGTSVPAREEEPARLRERRGAREEDRRRETRDGWVAGSPGMRLRSASLQNAAGFAPTAGAATVAPCTRTMKMQRGLRKPLESDLGDRATASAPKPQRLGTATPCSCARTVTVGRSLPCAPGYPRSSSGQSRCDLL